MPDKAASAGHNGYIWSRKLTQYGAILAGKTEMVFWESGLKYEMTLDRGDFFPFASSAVKGHFFEFLVSNILVTSLSRISGAALANGTHFFQLKPHFVRSGPAHMWVSHKVGCRPPAYFGLTALPPCLITPIHDLGDSQYIGFTPL